MIDISIPYARALVIANCLIALLFLILLLLQPVLIDSFHFDDTVLLANLGWRGVNGYYANIDYPHFYGGVVAIFVKWSFQIFGVDYVSINYAFIAMFLMSFAAFLTLSLKRLSVIGMSTLSVLSAALTLSLVPIEAGFIFGPESAHSYVYNHVAVVIIMGLTAFSAKVVPNRLVEATSALVAGCSIYALVLLKTTFAVFAPFIFLALLLQRRFRSIAFVVLGTVLGMLIMDLGMTRALDSLDVLLSSAAAERRSGLLSVIYSSLENVAAQLFAVLLIITLIIVLWARNRTLALRLSSVSALCGAGYLGALVSMAGTGSYMLLPILVVLSTLLADGVLDSYRSVSDGEDHATSGGIAIIYALPSALCYSFVLPALFSSAVTLFQSYRYQAASLIETGPAASYVVVGPAIETLADFEASVRKTRVAIDEAQEHGTWFYDSHEYVMYADGVRLLSRIRQIEEYGVISNGRMFAFAPAIGSRPVLSYPIWPTPNLDYFSTGGPLGADIDLVMISRDIPQLGLVGPSLIEKMADDFVVCRETDIWTLYARRELSSMKDLACERT